MSHKVLFLFQNIIIDNFDSLDNREKKPSEARILILRKLLMGVLNAYYLLTLLTLVIFYDYFTKANSYHSLVKLFQEEQFKTDYLHLFDKNDLEPKREWYEVWDHATSNLAYNWGDQRYLLVYLMILSWISMLWISKRAQTKPRKFFKVFRFSYFLCFKNGAFLCLIILWAFVQAIFCNFNHGKNVDGLEKFLEVLTLSFKAINMNLTLYYLVALDSKLSAVILAFINYTLIVFGLMQVCRAKVIDILFNMRKKKIVSSNPFDYQVGLVTSISNLCLRVKAILRKMCGCCAV